MRGKNQELAVRDYDVGIYEKFPFPLAVYQVIENELHFEVFTDSLIQLLGVDKEVVEEKLKFSPFFNCLEDDKSFVIDSLFWFLNNKENETNIIYTEPNSNSYSLINANVSKVYNDEKTYVYILYSRINSSQYDYSLCYKLLDSSVNAVNIVSQEDYTLLYANPTSIENKISDIKFKKDTKCYSFLFNRDAPCENCLIDKNIAEDSFTNEIYFEELDKYFFVHIQKILWKGKPAFIEYFNDISIEKKNYYRQQKELEAYETIVRRIINKRRNAENNFISFIEVDITNNILIYNDSQNYNIGIEKPTLEEAMSFSLSTIPLQSDRENFIKLFDRDDLLKSAKTGETKSLHYLVKYDDGSYHNIYLEVEFMRHPVSKNYLAFVYSYDVTKSLEFDLLLHSVVDKQNDFILHYSKIKEKISVFAKENNFLNLPKGFSILNKEQFSSILRQFCKKNHDEIGKSISCLSLFNNFNQEKLVSGNLEFSDENGKPVIKRVESFLETDSFDSVLVIAFDVTELVEKERVNNSNLLHALQQAKNASLAKSQFMARMSHDMRTPMNAIINLSDFGFEESANEKIKTYFKQIQLAGKYLSRLLNDILNMKEIKTEQIVLSSNVVNINTFIIAIETIIRLKAQKKNIKLVLDKKISNENSFLIFDLMRVEQIVINILTNSVKYTRPGGEICWKINLENRNNRTFCVFTISDTGVGMSDEFQEIMYESFAQEKNELSKEDGSAGLGLAIIKALVDKMQGTIECNSKIDEGTSFIISIPVEKASEEQIIKYLEDSNNSYDSEKILLDKKILLCEDNLINIKIVKKLLEKWGAIVDVAPNGLEGVNKAKSTNYNFIIMDIRMPVMDGLEASTKIREFDENIPIIAISANAYDEDVEASFRNGINYHLPKPINPKLLFNTLEGLLKYNLETSGL